MARGPVVRRKCRRLSCLSQRKAENVWEPPVYPQYTYIRTLDYYYTLPSGDGAFTNRPNAVANRVASGQPARARRAKPRQRETILAVWCPRDFLNLIIRYTVACRTYGWLVRVVRVRHRRRRFGYGYIRGERELRAAIPLWLRGMGGRRRRAPTGRKTGRWTATDNCPWKTLTWTNSRRSCRSGKSQSVCWDARQSFIINVFSGLNRNFLRPRLKNTSKLSRN